jgi:hypothetical protein
MARLRVRVELNRGGVGIPLHKLASVVEEARRFFQLLAEDVRIEKNQGEWLAFDLDNGSLNFTAEYVGPVSAEQVHAFYSAFDGVTSLRRATIAQFTRIAEAIGEDELIGFGLYQSDQETEPSEWRCLSRRDALRISDEIRILQGAAGGEPETHLRAVIDSDRGARLFKERHERSVATSDQSKWSSFVRAVESNLANRISRLENEVENHSGMIRDLRDASTTTEESFRNLLSSVEKFCGQATQQLERLSPQPPLLAAPPSASTASAFPSAPTFSTEPPEKSRRRWKILVLLALVAFGIVAATFLFWPSRSVDPNEPQPTAENAAPPADSGSPNTKTGPVVERETGETKSTASKPVAPPAKSAAPEAATNVAPPAAASQPGAAPMHIDLEARAAAWVSITDADGTTLLARILQPNETQTFEIMEGATLRTGNAGALVLRFNGTDVGPLGPTGKIRDVEFKHGTFKIRAPNLGESPTAADERAKQEGW